MKEIQIKQHGKIVHTVQMDSIPRENDILVIGSDRYRVQQCQCHFDAVGRDYVCNTYICIVTRDFGIS